MKTVKYDPEMELGKIFELVEQGVKITCNHCGSRLVTALDAESARKQKVHPGIYCPVDQKHVLLLFNLGASR
jgi:hypothetical protein